MAEGERASPEGEVRRTKFGSAADYIFCGFAADYKKLRRYMNCAPHLPLDRRAFPLSHFARRALPLSHFDNNRTYTSENPTIKHLVKP